MEERAVADRSKLGAVSSGHPSCLPAVFDTPGPTYSISFSRTAFTNSTLPKES